jgi:hypothetical protein
LPHRHIPERCFCCFWFTATARWWLLSMRYFGVGAKCPQRSKPDVLRMSASGAPRGHSTRGRPPGANCRKPALHSIVRTEKIPPWNQFDSIYPVLSAKVFLFSPNRNHRLILSRPASLEGRIAIVTDVECGMRWTQGALRRERGRRTAKSCGPGASTLASSWRS